MVRRQRGLRIRFHHRCRRNRRRHHRLRRGLPAGTRLLAGLRRRRAHRNRRTRPAPDRPRSSRTRPAEQAHGSIDARPSLREVADRHRLLGHSGQGHQLARGHAARRPLRAGFRALSRHLAGRARENGGDGEHLSRPGLHQVPAQSGRRPGHRHRAHHRRARAPRARRRPDRRRQHRLAAAPGAARGRRGARRGRLHRAALPELPGMPGGAPAHQSPVHSRRSDRRSGDGGARRMPTRRWT